MKESKTYTFKEYGDFTSLSEVASKLNLQPTVFWNLINNATKPLLKNFPKQSFIETKGFNFFRFTGIAGVLSLSGDLKIEIIPKFLSNDNESWRDDFLYISILAETGHLFRTFPLFAKAVNKSDLFEIITLAWLAMFEENSRNMIKMYSMTSWYDYTIDGDVDEEDLTYPSADGFKQHGLKLSQSNKPNTVLRLAAIVLKQQNTYNYTNSARLEKAIEILNNSLRDKLIGKPKYKVRFDERWSDLIDLSQTILSNLSMGFNDSGYSIMPGYIINTHDTWEKLIFKSSMLAFTEMTVKKSAYYLGTRFKPDGEKNFSSTPDISIYSKEKLLYIVDAKYKHISKKSNYYKSIISSTDIYESISFLIATGCKKIFLIYPSDNLITDYDLSAQPLERFKSESVEIIAVSLGVTGMSSKKGFNNFCDNLKNLVETL